MASLITVRLDKGSSPNLGFRLQGGKDFGTPLVVQKVNGGSPAERAGLIAGDSVIKINQTDVFNLRHKDAQDVIVRAGPSFEITVQRGGSTWKPSVTPIGSYQTTPSIQNASPVTKTSLAATKKENIGSIGTGHNVSAKPFSAQLNGTVNGGPKLVNNQYNSPLKLYSEESIAETLSAQTEVLSTGALGVNFKKNEKNYDATNSAVYRMLQEAEKEPKTPEAVSPSADFYATHSHAIGGRSNKVLSPTPLRSSVDDRSNSRQSETTGNPSDQEGGVTKCSDCERVIVGVFVRIKDKNLHVECFKCSTCGTSLKNVGYYNINNKLYCDVHAKLAALNNRPAANLVPVTVPPGGKAPVGTITAALSSHSLPSPSPLSPKTNLAQPFQAGSYSTAPKPFSSVSAPNYNTLPKAAPPAPLAPLSPVASAPAPSFSPASSTTEKNRSVNIVWPPPLEEPEVPTASPLYFPPPSQVKVKPKKLEVDDNYCEELEEIDKMAMYQTPKTSYYSEEFYEATEGRRSAVECIGTIAETLETQKLVENVLRAHPRQPSPPPLDKDIKVSEMKVKETKESIKQEAVKASTIVEQRDETIDLRRPTEYTPNTVECQMKSQIENAVPKKWESQMVQALKTLPDSPPKDPFTQIPSKHSFTPLASALAIAPSEPFNPLPPMGGVDPVPLPEETEPYFPPERPVLIETTQTKSQKPDSEFVSALRTAPERPFTPVGAAPVPKKKKDPFTEYFKDLPKPERKLTMRDALTTASDRPYTPIIESVEVESNETKKQSAEHLQSSETITVGPKPVRARAIRDTMPIAEQKPPEPPSYPWKFQERTETKTDVTEEQKIVDIQTSTTVTEQKEKTIAPNIRIEEQQIQGFYPLFKGFSCSFDTTTEHSHFNVEVSTSPPVPNLERFTPVKISQPSKETVKTETKVVEQSRSETVSKESKEKKVIEKQAEDVVLKKPLPLAAGLHKPETLPQYQKNISDNAEAELLMMKKKEEAAMRLQQQKSSTQIQAEQSSKPIITVQPTEQDKKLPQENVIKKPVITVQPGENNLRVEQAFMPVREDRPPKTTFSPRPGSITPSMINKPPAVLPYYQANLVAQQYMAPPSNIFDPTSPATSRSPSPHPDLRPPSPFRTSHQERPKSPAAGPPPNPLRTNQPLPRPQDVRVETAKKNVETFIPQHKNWMMHESGAFENIQQTAVCEKTCPIKPKEGECCKKIQKGQEMVCERAGDTRSIVSSRQTEDAASFQRMSQKAQGADISMAVAQYSHLEHSEQASQQQLHSVERSKDGRVQVQRKKTVVEEFEHTQKAQMMEIERNVTKTTSRPVGNVRAEAIESNVQQNLGGGVHVTNPQQLSQTLLKPKVEPKPQQAAPLSQPRPLVVAEQTRPASFRHVPAPPEIAPIRHVQAPSGSKQKPSGNQSNVPVPNTGTGGGRQAGAVGVAPKRGRGVLNAAAIGGARVPLCGHCHNHIRGPFITALGKIWCPEHFICATPSCRRPLQDLGFVEERGQLYCEYCFEQYLAPPCSKCGAKIKGDCLKAIGKNFHPECFNCVYCGKLFGNSPFFLEDGNPYCEADWNELFTTKCFACGFPVEAGDRWVEALNNNYHSQCFNCTMCKKNLEGQSFFAKGGRPYCKNHAR